MARGKRNPVDVEVGRRVRLALKVRGLPDAALTDVLGMTQSGVSQKLAGLTWTVWDVVRTAAFFNLEPGDLMPNSADSLEAAS